MAKEKKETKPAVKKANKPVKETKKTPEKKVTKKVTEKPATKEKTVKKAEKVKETVESKPAIEKKEAKKTTKPKVDSKEDTGSVDFQINNFSDKIKSLAKHLKTHTHDFDSRRGLLIMVGKRRRLLNYLKKSEPAKYEEAVKALKLKA